MALTYGMNIGEGRKGVDPAAIADRKRRQDEARQLETQRAARLPVVQATTPLSPEAAVFTPRPTVGPVAPVTAGVVEALGAPERLQPAVAAAPVAPSPTVVTQPAETTAATTPAKAVATPVRQAAAPVLPRVLSRAERQAAADASMEMTSPAAASLAARMTLGRMASEVNQTGSRADRMQRIAALSDEANRMRWQDAMDTALEAAMSPSQRAAWKAAKAQRAMEAGKAWAVGPEGRREKMQTERDVKVASEQGRAMGGKDGADNDLARRREDRAEYAGELKSARDRIQLAQRTWQTTQSEEDRAEYDAALREEKDLRQGGLNGYIKRRDAMERGETPQPAPTAQAVAVNPQLVAAKKWLDDPRNRNDPTYAAVLAKYQRDGGR